MRTLVRRTTILAAAAAAATLLAGCERPPMETKQVGYRGTGMEQVTNPRIVRKEAALHQIPVALPAAPSDGPKAREIYKNVQVLGDLSVAEFTRLMVSITSWVSPEQGCNYCHNPADLADDGVYTKVVARKMLQMNLHLNANWKQHVAETGVTCYTCHRGKPVPANVWSAQPEETRPQGLLGMRGGQNAPAESVGLSSLPFDPFSAFLVKDLDIRVVPTAALPGTTRDSIKQAEWTYGLMMHMSDGLGVNCTYCHNSGPNFQSWSSAPPARATAWYGIRMVRDINVNYIDSIANVFPEKRKGPLGDVLKTNCATCHQGVSKPLKGVSMLKDFPELTRGARTGTPATAAPAPAAPATSSLGQILFATGRTDLNQAAVKAIAAAAEAMKNDAALKLAISGFADQTGKADANLELAKKRAFAVRDALTAAGVAGDRIELRKPEFVVGATPESRRVDLIASK